MVKTGYHRKFSVVLLGKSNIVVLFNKLTFSNLAQMFHFDIVWLPRVHVCVCDL